MVKTSLLSMRALCTSISIFWPLEKLRAFQFTLAFTVTLSADVAKMRAGLHESQTQKETFDAEAKRYKVRFTDNAAVHSRTFNDVLFP